LTARPQLKESFDMKTITYIVGTPDEIANALLNEKTRSLWDPNAKSATKTGDNSIKIVYNTSDSFSEAFTYQFVCDKEG